MQINISSINNGFLVGTPPKEKTIIAAAQSGQQAQPVIEFCADFDEVVQAIKKHWPVTITD